MAADNFDQTSLNLVIGRGNSLGQLGPGQLGPGAQLSGAQFAPDNRAQFATFSGRTTGPRTIGPRAHVVFGMIFFMIYESFF